MLCLEDGTEQNELVGLSQGAYTFEPVEGGTKVTLAFEAGLGGFFKLAKPIVARAFKRPAPATWRG